MKKYDLFVIGAGPAGYPAAIAAARKGLSVGIAECRHMGGTCTNYGCIPTKTYVETSNLLRRMSNAKKFGIERSGGNPAVNMAALKKRKDRVVLRLARGIDYLLSESSVDVFDAAAAIEAPGVIAVGDESVVARNILVATGSRPFVPEMFKGRGILASDDVFLLEEIPESLLIVGGGVVGIEMAHIFSSLGCAVSVVEAMDRILPMEDEDVASSLMKRYRNVRFFVSSRVSSIEGDEPYSVNIGTPDGDLTVVTEKVLVCIGREPVVPEGTDRLGIETGPRGGIVVDEYMRTSADGVYAAGDVTGEYMLAYVATKEAVVAVEHMAGGDVKMNYSNIPSVVFCDPEVASVGSIPDGEDIRIGTFPVAALGRARTMEENDGFARVCTDSGGRIMKVTIVGPHATELVSWASLAVERGLNLDEFLEPHYPHPTMSELLKEAAEDADGMCLHKV